MIPIYQAEKHLDLTSSRLSYASALTPVTPFPVPNLARGEKQEDLYYYRSLLVSSVWNLNDDVFDPLEIWKAQRSPEDKPVNYEHNCADIVGHMTSCQLTGDDGQNLATASVDELPQLVHLTVSSVLYRFWDRPDLQDRMDTLVREIAAGQWFVSMECLFNDFDYALLSKDGPRIITRNKETSFLSAKLRAYGGDGTHEGQRIGRLLRGFTFSGKGLVKNPANPASVIFTAANFKGYLNLEENNHMSDDIKVQLEKEKSRADSLQSQLDQLRGLYEPAAKKLGETEASLKASQEAQKQLASEAETAKKGLEARLAEANTALQNLTRERDELKSQLTLAAREARVADKLGLAGEAAQKMAKSLLALSGEDFDAHLNSLASLKAPAEKAEASKVLDEAKPTKEPPLAAAPAPISSELGQELAGFFGSNS